MNVYQMSLVAVMGLGITMVGVFDLAGDKSIYPLAVGLAVFGAALVQGIRSLQKQIDQLKSAAQPPQQERTHDE